jgi:hypothetical protein
MTDRELLKWIYKELEFVQTPDEFEQFILFTIEYKITEQLDLGK